MATSSAVIFSDVRVALASHAVIGGCTKVAVYELSVI